MYVEDALGDRVWVDLEPCTSLVANMCSLFATKAGKAGEGNEPHSVDVGELSKEGFLSGIETAPRYILHYCA